MNRIRLAAGALVLVAAAVLFFVYRDANTVYAAFPGPCGDVSLPAATDVVDEQVFVEREPENRVVIQYTRQDGQRSQAVLPLKADPATCKDPRAQRILAQVQQELISLDRQMCDEVDSILKGKAKPVEKPGAPPFDRARVTRWFETYCAPKG